MIKSQYCGGFLLSTMLFASLFSCFLTIKLCAEPLRPPSVPLVTCDPYFSIWSPGDRLTDADTVHWTGALRRMTGLVKIDGKNFRVMGAEPAGVPALPQAKLETLPTRTIYTFEGQGIRLTLVFMSPKLPSNLDLLSRP